MFRGCLFAEHCKCSKEYPHSPLECNLCRLSQGPSIILLCNLSRIPHATTFGVSYNCYITCFFVFFIVTFIGSRLILFLEDPTEQLWKGYFYASLMLIATVARSIFLNHFYFLQNQLSMNTLGALVPIVYRKTLAISSNAKKGRRKTRELPKSVLLRHCTVLPLLYAHLCITEFSSGKITNLMTVDVDRIRDLMWTSNLPWSTPLQLALVLYFLWAQLGPSVLVGFGAFVLLIPINWFIFQKLNKLQCVQMETKDGRIKMLDEILSGIRILKLFAWELSYEDKVRAIREKEIRNLWTQSYLNALMEVFCHSSPFLVSMATFATYMAIDPMNKLDARKAFVSIALFNLLKVPINGFPRFWSQVAKARISFKRLNDFLNAEEKDTGAVTWLPLSNLSLQPSEPLAVEIVNGKFTWGESQEIPTLSAINIGIRTGHLVAVVGAVASGKSSLLGAVLGDLKKVEGKASVLRSVAYVSQTPWIQNSTVKVRFRYSIFRDEPTIHLHFI